MLRPRFNYHLDLVIGRTVGHYEVESSLGQGGMGVVYRARDSRLGRSVALKFLPPEFTASVERRERFLREARAASAVNHPAIAQVYDVGEDGEGGAYIAMELIEGRTLRSVIASRELDLLGAVEVGTQVARGLAKAHEAGIVHRDIKPENVMLTSDGHAKILDFGLAKLHDTPSGAGDELSHMETMARTQSGMVVGTLRYMSPEQARGRSVDHRTDIFSLGIVLYEMVTGQLPFAGGTPLDTLHAIAFEETQPVTQIRPNLPTSLQRVVTRCLRKRPEDRYATASELAADLKVLQREVESGATSNPAAAGFAADLRERFAFLRQAKPADLLLPAGLVLGGVVLGLGLFGVERGTLPALLLFGWFGLLVWRRIRNRPMRLLKGFTRQMAKIPEVSLLTVEGQRVTVVADRAVASTYVRVHAALDAMNAKIFFGDAFTVAVHDGVTADEERALLRGGGVVYVRDDAKSGKSAGALRA